MNWDWFKQLLDTPFGSAKLKIDSDVIAFEVRRVSGRTIKYQVMTYVNGVSKLSHCYPDKKGKWAEESKYYRPVSKALRTPKEKRAILKRIGKKLAAEIYGDLDRCYEYKDALWPTVGGLVAYYKKNFPQAELVED